MRSAGQSLVIVCGQPQKITGKILAWSWTPQGRKWILVGGYYIFRFGAQSLLEPIVLASLLPTPQFIQGRGDCGRDHRDGPSSGETQREMRFWRSSYI